MAKTIAQYEYLDRDKLMKGVVEWIVYESPLLKKLPQIPVKGNSYKYNVELTLPTVSWVSVGDQISSNTGTVAQRTADIYQLIGEAHTDKFAIATNSEQDPEKIDIDEEAKAMAHEWEKTVIMGRTTTDSDAKEFKGLMQLIAEFESEATTDLDAVSNSQVVAGHATSAAMTMPMMDELIDAVKPGKPDLLLMSKRMRRWLNALSRASGSSGLTLQKSEEFGIFMEHYDGIPIYISEWVPDNLPDGSSSVLSIASYNQATTRASGYDNSIIFALKLGEKDVAGLQAGNMKHEVIDPYPGYNVRANRFTWYCGLAAFKKFSAACLINVLDVALS